VPFQRRISVLPPAEPTAHALRADKTATPLKLPGVLNEATVPAGAVRTVPAALAPARPDAITATPAPAVHTARIMRMLISSYPLPQADVTRDPMWTTRSMAVMPPSQN